MFIAALFIIARTWKKPRCPSADTKTFFNSLGYIPKRTLAGKILFSFVKNKQTTTTIKNPL